MAIDRVAPRAVTALGTTLVRAMLLLRIRADEIILLMLLLTIVVVDIAVQLMTFFAFDDVQKIFWIFYGARGACPRSPARGVM